MVAARARALRIPVRWFSVPQLFRYERPQKGRLREHYQLNVDIVGEAPPAPDAELLACGIDVMRAFGLTSEDVVARASDRRLLTAYLESVGVRRETLAGVYAVIDKLHRQPESVSVERLEALGVGRAGIDGVLVVPGLALGELRRVLESTSVAGSAALEHLGQFEAYLTYLTALGVGDFVQFDLSIVRGLAYYTGIVFELFDRRGEFRAICGGGRYDNLLASLGGPDLAALGFGMGDVVLTELLRARGLLQAPEIGLDYWVAGEDGVPLEAIMRKAAELRALNHVVEYSLRGQSLSKQMKTAKTLGAREIIVLPAHETNG
jgi:histidyl-tRNA synthetase